jgi:hypothetical protein
MKREGTDKKALNEDGNVAESGISELIVYTTHHVCRSCAK